MGRPAKNTLKIDWKARLELFWDRCPSYRMTPGELCVEMRAIDPVETPEIDDFRLKFDGRRPSNERFAIALFQASRAGQVGLSQPAFLADANVWESEIDGLEGSDLKALLEANLTGDSFRAEIRRRPTTDRPGLRRISKETVENQLSIGSHMQIVCTYLAEEVLLKGYLMALEFDRRAGDWQVFGALEGSGVDHQVPIKLGLEQTERVASVDIEYAVSGPANTFDMYVVLSRKPFDHRLLALLKTGSLPEDGLLSAKQTTDLCDLISSELDSVLVATCAYQVV
ncbi:hypothetical protein [Phaeobacter porticola]|uniref:Uncharacterized protein n=1 Tax=Phaeobacter porticola TaxID=1844006 RepID=A0A1L3I777_9RHOB|nr:hypothetical protein [Phaeobacter porticola]APG47891.1 hypothetical protein PhaeoP97_02508 [Phaeobacter porticola]